MSIFSLQEELCPRSTGVSSHECVWASAVSVRDKYVYVTQPLHNRLLLIDTQAQRVVQVRRRVLFLHPAVVLMPYGPQKENF